MLAFSIIIASISQVILILFVLGRARRNLTNILFSLIGVASLGWALTSYFSIVLSNSAHVLLIIRLVMLFVVLQNTAFYLFAQAFPSLRIKRSKRWITGYVFASVVVALAAISPYLFTSVSVTSYGTATTPGPAILLFIIHALYSIGAGFRSLLRKFRAARGGLRLQLKILLTASILVWVIVPITNFAVTPLLQTTFFVELSPLYTFIFDCIIAYAIISQGLFGIRVIVARSTAYVLTVGLFIVLYSSIVLGVSSLLADREGVSLNAQIIYTVSALLLAFAFTNIKNFFDKFTNRLFFRDAYNPQVFLDDLNQVLVTKMQLEPLLRAAQKVISRHLQLASAGFIVNEVSSKQVRLIGPAGWLEPQFAAAINTYMSTAHRVVATAMLTDEHDELLQLLESHDVALVVKLSSSMETANRNLGYMLLGPKRSGQLYTGEDMKLLSIIANELVIAIENSFKFDEIQAFNQTLQERVDEATRKLRASNEKLKKLDETKDEFVSMASHQLRTPLTSVKGYLSMVLEGDGGELNTTQRQMLTQSFASSQRMVYLISGLLNLSRLNTGKFVIESGPVDLRDVVAAEIDQLRETAKARELTLTYEPPENFPTLMLDETKIHQVVMNFMDNAIYYTPPGGKVSIVLRETATAIEFRVKDSGIGVSREVQRHLFTKFYRADNARRMRPDGTGLGLFMAKKIVVAQGGAILFESEVDKGSMFGFRFQKASHALAMPQKPAEAA